MINSLLEYFSYGFMIKALIVGLLVSLCAALLGVSLVLKRYSMIGDGLSHVGFASLAIAITLNQEPLLISIPIVIIAAFLLLKLNENNNVKGDSAIALIASSSLAIGVIITSLNTGTNINVYEYMFGSILAISNADVIISIALSIIVLTLFVVFYNIIFSITFDENFAKATGIKTNYFNMLLAFLTSITIVIGMRIMGTMLISSLVIFPSLTSMRLFKNFKSVTISSAIISATCFLLGLITSFKFDLPVGAIIVITNLVAFIIFSIISKLINKNRI